MKGGNILEYKVKANALLNPSSSHPSTILTLQPVQAFEHKHKKEKTPPLDICEEVQNEFIVVHKKCLTKHGSQIVKQISKQKKNSSTMFHQNLTLGKNCNTVVLDHTFSI